MSGDDFEFTDKRLLYIYQELKIRYPFKPDTWLNMIQTPAFSVSICGLICSNISIFNFNDLFVRN